MWLYLPPSSSVWWNEHWNSLANRYSLLAVELSNFLVSGSIEVAVIQIWALLGNFKTALMLHNFLNLFIYLKLELLKIVWRLISILLEYFTTFLFFYSLDDCSKWVNLVTIKSSCYSAFSLNFDHILRSWTMTIDWDLLIPEPKVVSILEIWTRHSWPSHFYWTACNYSPMTSGGSWSWTRGSSWLSVRGG